MPIEGNGKLSNWSRVAVHDGNPGLYEGRCFKSLWRGSLSNNQSLWLRFRPDVDALILGQSLSISSGQVRAIMYAGCTESGSWTPQPVFGMNGSERLRRQPHYSSQVEVAIGGTCTGGIEVGSVEIYAGAGNSASTTGSDFAGPQITGPGTYNLRLLNLSNSTVPFLYRSWWEEIPEQTGWESFPV